MVVLDLEVSSLYYPGLARSVTLPVVIFVVVLRLKSNFLSSLISRFRRLPIVWFDLGSSVFDLTASSFLYFIVSSFRI